MSSLPVSDAIFYLYYAFLIVGSTIGFDSNDLWYGIGTGLGAILAMSAIASKRFSHRDLCLIGLAFALSAAVAFAARSLTLLLTTVVVASSKGMKLESLLSFFLIVKLIAFSTFLCLGAVGFFETTVVSHYSALVGEMISRKSINGVATNILHLGLFAIITMFISLKREKLSLISYVVMMLLNVLFYYFVSYSSGGLVVTGIVLLLGFGIRYSRTISGLLCKFSHLIIPATVVFFLYTGFRFDGTGWIAEVNHLVTGRIAYNHYWLTAHGATLFGLNPSGLPAAFDNSVVYMLVGQGVFAAFVFLGGYWIAMRRLGKAGNAYLLLAVVAFYLFSMSESILPSIVVNPSLMIVLGALVPSFYSLEGVSRR